MPRMIVFAALALLSLTGCMHVISKVSRDAVTPGATLAAVRAEPDRHLGETLLVGGNILGQRPQGERTLLEVYSWTLDRCGKPREFDADGGRFLVILDQRFDLLHFAPGRFVVLTGAVDSSLVLELDGNDYTYPLLRIAEIHLLEVPHHYDGPPRVNKINPSHAPPWHEQENPYDPTPGKFDRPM